MVATSQLDIDLLHQSYELGVHHGFLPAEVYEECEAAAQLAAMNKVKLELVQTIGSRLLIFDVCFAEKASVYIITGTVARLVSASVVFSAWLCHFPLA